MAKRKIYDIYSDITPQVLLNQIMDAVEYRCIQHRGTNFDFEFSPVRFVLSFTVEFHKEKTFWGERWRESCLSHSDQNQLQLSKMQTAIRMLPVGITAQLVVKSVYDDRNQIPPPIIARETTDYKVVIAVSEKYSSEVYSNRVHAGIVHAKVSEAFMNAAKMFRNNLLEKHESLIDNLVSKVNRYITGNIFIQLDCISSSEEYKIAYCDFGMKPLTTWEQAYGLAWCIAEKKHSYYGCWKLRVTEYFIDISFYPYKNEAPPLSDW